jgi:hypothetical protein
MKTPLRILNPLYRWSKDAEYDENKAYEGFEKDIIAWSYGLEEVIKKMPSEERWLLFVYIVRLLNEAVNDYHDVIEIRLREVTNENNS